MSVLYKSLLLCVCFLGTTVLGADEPAPAPAAESTAATEAPAPSAEPSFDELLTGGPSQFYNAIGDAVFPRPVVKYIIQDALQTSVYFKTGVQGETPPLEIVDFKHMIWSEKKAHSVNMGLGVASTALGLYLHHATKSPRIFSIPLLIGGIAWSSLSGADLLLDFSEATYRSSFRVQFTANAGPDEQLSDVQCSLKIDNFEADDALSQIHGHPLYYKLSDCEVADVSAALDKKVDAAFSLATRLGHNSRVASIQSTGLILIPGLIKITEPLNEVRLKLIVQPSGHVRSRSKVEDTERFEYIYAFE